MRRGTWVAIVGLLLMARSALAVTPDARSLLARPTTKPIRWASPTAKAAFEYGPYPTCLSGGWGAGKTHTACLKAIYLSTEYPKNRGAIIRRVGKELRYTTMATFYKVCPARLYDRRRGGARSDVGGYCRLTNGSDILFLHLEDPDTAGIIRGLEINWFLWDQAEEGPDEGEELFDMLTGRLGRWDLAEVPARHLTAYRETFGGEWPFRHPESDRPVPPPYGVLCVNPDVETHWIYLRFHPESAEHHARYKALGYQMFQMPSEENRFLGQTNLHFLLQHDEAFIRRNVKGLWGSPEGAIHSVDPLSIVEGYPEVIDWIRQTCLLYRTLDHGDSSPTACDWWGVDQAGNVFLFREYYQPNKTISYHRESIGELSRHESYEGNYADPTIFHQLPTKKGGRWSVADEYTDTELTRAPQIFWSAADNNELATRNRINEYLRVDRARVHPIYRTLGAPRLYFVTPTDAHPNGVIHSLRELRNQRRVKIGTHLGKPVFSEERDPTIPDHGYDNVRYFIASRTPAPPAITDGGAGTFEGARARMAKLQRQRLGMR